MTVSASGPRRDEAGADQAPPGATPVLGAAVDADEDAWWLALTAEDFARQDEIWAIEQEAREAGRLPDIDPDDYEGYDFDPDCAPPVTADWVPGMPCPEEPAPAPDLFPADLLDRDTDPGRPDGPPFAKGSPLDVAPPSPVLAGKLDHTAITGFGDYSDDQMAGVMLAATRMQSRATAQLLAATSELAHRRAADPDPRVAEATGTEVAVVLAKSRRAAERLLRFATDLDPLPATRAALWDGRIDAVKAELIGYETGLLPPDLAAAAELLVIEDAPRLTSTTLRARLRRAVIAADPAAARRRADRARREARVELYDEQSGGTAALSGRDLPVAGALAADQRIDATARALKRAGVKATLAQLRAAVFLGLLTGGDPRTFLPPNDDEGDGTPSASPAHDASPASATGADAPPTATGTGSQLPTASSGDAPAQPGTTTDDGQSAADRNGGGGQPAPPGGQPGPTGPGTGTSPRRQAGTTPPSSPGSSDPAATGPGTPDPAGTPDTTTRPHSAGTPDQAGTPDRASPAGAPETDGPESPEDGAGGWPGRLTLRGSVHLTMPLATWLGASLSPGEITGLGPATAQTCQEVADWIAENPGTRWCLTLTNRAGHAVAHGCARRPPPPAADTQRLAEWLARLKITPIQAGTCTHARQVPGYRPPKSLHHAVQVRQKTCFNPVCATPAHNTDDDHTIPYDQGGRTCECDLGPGCRKCHRVKQTPGWKLEQPSPGVFAWRLPNGRSYTIYPGIYPT